MKEKKSDPITSGHIDRRTFIKGVVAAGGLATLPSGVFGAAARLRQIAPSEKVNIAIVGIGNRGGDIMRALQATGLVNVVALCDSEIGGPRTLNALKANPNVPQFHDFRTMFDKMGKQFDAVCVGTPDHSHFPVTMLAMSQGKHVFIEKPLAHSYRQIELMMAGEKKYKVACQMGNQGHSEANYFQFKAWKEAGIIKNVTKIDAHMNGARRWHGMYLPYYMPAEPKPDYLDWDCWIATARIHPYHNAYMNGEWRSWFEYGNGLLGDWGPHIFDTAHEFLELGLPTVIDPVRIDGHSHYLFPQASTIALQFPARGQEPACTLTWYDGVKNLPTLPPGFDGNPAGSNAAAPAKALSPGKIIYGEGLTFKGGSHGSTLEIIPKSAAADLKLPEVPKSTSNHFLNFVRACRGEEACRSHLGVAGPLCQVMALGVISQRVNARLEFDAKTRRITNHKVANALLNGDPPRKGWEQFYKM